MHLRYLAGGRPPAGEIPHEKLYRFQFPESPGALDRFLSAISGDWNVTLFHYRSHGCADEVYAPTSPVITTRRDDVA